MSEKCVTLIRRKEGIVNQEKLSVKEQRIARKVELLLVIFRIKVN